MRSIRATTSRALASVRAVADGLRYSKQLAPAVGENFGERPSPGRLAAYFDEHTEGPGLWKWRHYFPIYERHLQRFVGREIHIVEVGIFSGGSLPMWLEYFGAGAHIYGIDIEEACRGYAGDRIEIHIGDQADPAFWADFLRGVPRVDVLIDDGGHEGHQQIATLKATLPAISPGGVYLCEDSHRPGHAFHSFVDALGRGLHHVGSGEGREPSALQQHIESIHRYPLVTVIEKPLLPMRWFESPRHGTQWEPFL